MSCLFLFRCVFVCFLFFFFRYDDGHCVKNDLSFPVRLLNYISKRHKGMNKLFTIGSLSCHVCFCFAVCGFAIFSSDMIISTV